jgi:hypothetical protein
MCWIIAIPTTNSFNGHPHKHWHGPNIAIGHHYFDIATTNSNKPIHHVIVFSISPEANI